MRGEFGNRKREPTVSNISGGIRTKISKENTGQFEKCSFERLLGASRSGIVESWKFD